MRRQCVLCDGAWMTPREADEETLECERCGVTEANDLPRPDPRRTRCQGLGKAGCREKFETFVTRLDEPVGQHLGPKCYERLVQREATA